MGIQVANGGCQLSRPHRNAIIDAIRRAVSPPMHIAKLLPGAGTQGCDAGQHQDICAVVPGSEEDSRALYILFFLCQGSDWIY